MDPTPVVLDISSDEEPALEKGPESSDYDWIKELLGDSDNESDDSDEVTVVRVVKPELKSKSWRPSVKDVDDDCVVLDGDPENGVTSLNEAATASDELLIVGEKGQIACRDYPHPRHLCAKFPFSSTPHERHCEQCHCYVCDLLAPCLQWSTGISSTDHCHATDKAEMWKIQRKNFKLGARAPLPASTNHTSPSMTNPQHNQVLPLNIIRFSENSRLQNQVSRASAMHTSSSLNCAQERQSYGPTVLHACFPSLDSTIHNEVSRPNAIPACSSTIFTVPSGTNHGRCLESGSTLARNRYQPRLISRQLLGVHNNAIRRDRGHSLGNLGPRFHRSYTISKEVGNVGATLTVNNSAHGSSGHSNHVNPAHKYDRYHATTGLLNERNDNGWNDAWLTTNLSAYPNPSSAQPRLNCVSGNTMTSKTQEFSQPLAPSNDSQNIYQSCIQGNEVPNYVACLNSSQHGSQNENAGEHIIYRGSPSQDTCQQQPHEGNQSETARKEDFSAFDASWTKSDSPSIEPLTESSCVQGSVSINQQSVVKESDVRSARSTNLIGLDDIEHWLLDKDSVPGVTDASFASFLNIPSPDLSPIDEGMLLF